MTSPNEPDLSSLTRAQVLVAIAVSAIAFLVLAKLWLYFGSVQLLAVRAEVQDLLLGVGLGSGITVASALVYWLWPAYRQSTDFYLDMVLRPLAWPDLIWLGLLPGLSEELLFRGVMLPALGLNPIGILVTALCFGVLHLSSLEHWPYVVWATIIGIVLGYSALWTGNLLVPVLAHIVTNSLSSGLWKWRERLQA